MEPQGPVNADKHPPIPPEWNLRCCNCEYDLTGLTVHRCPECGEPFDIDDTLRANRRSTWEYLLENRCSAATYPVFLLMHRLGVSASTMERLLRRADYAFYGTLVVFGVLFILLALDETLALGALMLWVPAEMIIAATGRGRVWFRLIVWTICFAWAVLVWLP